jgi:hypothetical protein
MSSRHLKALAQRKAEKEAAARCESESESSEDEAPQQTRSFAGLMGSDSDSGNSDNGSNSDAGQAAEGGEAAAEATAPSVATPPRIGTPKAGGDGNVDEEDGDEDDDGDGEGPSSTTLSKQQKNRNKKNKKKAQAADAVSAPVEAAPRDEDADLLDRLAAENARQRDTGYSMAPGVAMVLHVKYQDHWTDIDCKQGDTWHDVKLRIQRAIEKKYASWGMDEHRLPPLNQKLTLNGKELFDLDQRLSSSKRLEDASNRKVHVSFFAGKAAAPRRGPRFGSGSGSGAGASGGAASPPPAPSAPKPMDVSELPYGGDVQKAMRAQDRAAIRAIMTARNKHEAGVHEAGEHEAGVADDAGAGAGGAAKGGAGSGRAPAITVRDLPPPAAAAARPPSAAAALEASAAAVDGLDGRVQAALAERAVPGATDTGVGAKAKKTEGMLVELLTQQILRLDELQLSEDGERRAEERQLRRGLVGRIEALCARLSGEVLSVADCEEMD